MCVHACSHPSVSARVRGGKKKKKLCVVCHRRAGSLMCSPAYQLYVKPLHCSTASGISAGTALFFSLTLHPHNREIKFGPHPSCVKSSSLKHAHLPVFIRYAPESAGQLRARPPPKRTPVGSLFAPHESPLPTSELWQQSWRATCLGDRQEETERGRENMS